MAPRKAPAKKKTPAKRPATTGGQHPGVPPIPDATPPARERTAPHRIVNDVIEAERDRATANRAPLTAEQRAT